MREKSSECSRHADANQVRAMTEMCSRDPAPAVLQQHHHPALVKAAPALAANGKRSASPQQHPLSPPSSSSSSRPNSSSTGTPAASPVLLNHHHHHSHHHRQDQQQIDDQTSSQPQPGGRLKFFKDGKFILELSHRRDGERTTWFPVPKKTFWPPASVPPSRQESSASLSVSDDNSSIQSSPWQRDHCWKQSNPRRNISTEFNFYYRRNRKIRLSVHPRLIARKRRQPLDPCSSLMQLQESLATNHQNKQQQQSNQPQRKLNGAPQPNKSLNLIIDKLARLLDPNVVSPRKRILRELERVTLEDQASKRRATPPHATNSAVTTNEISAVSTATAAGSKQLSSYSITSILGEDKQHQHQQQQQQQQQQSSQVESEPGFLRNLLKPHDRHNRHSPHQHRHSPQHHRHSPQHQRNSPQHHRNSPQQQPQHSPQHQLSPRHQVSPQPVYPRSSRGLDPTSIAYLGPNVASSIHQPLYGLPILPPAAYRAPPFCWMPYTQPVHYPPPIPLYAGPPQPPPPHTPSPSPPAHRYKDYREQTLTPPSDMPLNLSKH